MKKSVIEYKNLLLGQTQFELKVVRSKRRKKTLALSMQSPSQLTMHVPFNTSLHSIDHFIQEHTSWIFRKHAVLTSHQKENPPREFQQGENIYYLGQEYRLHIMETKQGKRGCTLQNDYIEIVIRPTVEESLRKKTVMALLTKWYWQQANEKVQQRAAFWSEQLNLPVTQLMLSRPKKRWGSCNAQNVIRINWVLIMAPLELLDYVIVHELCHIAHKDHSSHFWKLVASVMPDYKNHRVELSKWESYLVL